MTSISISNALYNPEEGSVIFAWLAKVAIINKMSFATL